MRFIALDSLRGIAALLVALSHLAAAGAFYDLPFIRHGRLALPLFFVLSGFVITHAYGARLHVPADGRAFMIRRFGRIYPLHLFTLALLVIIEFGKLALVFAGIKSGQAPFAGTNDGASLIANVFLLHAVIPFGDYTWNVPSWSISAEFYSYAVFAILLIGFRPWWPLVWAGAALLSGATLIALEVGGVHLHDTSGAGLLQCVFGFFCGSAAYRLFSWLRRHRSGFGSLAEIAAMGILAALFWYAPLGAFGTIVSFTVVILILAFDDGAVSRILAAAPFRFLGRISYSIYLVHFVVLSVLNGVLRALQSALDVALLQPGSAAIAFGPPGAMDALAAAYILLLIPLAAWTYRLVEVPGRIMFNQLAEGAPLSQALAASWPGSGRSHRGSAHRHAAPQALRAALCADDTVLERGSGPNG
jgi:peptidoglycan/LPS O-acetylase OafA/YrhL